jgi:hypothetical protein
MTGRERQRRYLRKRWLAVAVPWMTELVEKDELLALLGADAVRSNGPKTVKRRP